MYDKKKPHNLVQYPAIHQLYFYLTCIKVGAIK